MDDPAAVLEERAAALLDVDVSQEDVHRFLLDTADLLGSPPREMVGPGLRFRWFLDDRVVQVGAGKGIGTDYSIKVQSFSTEVVDDIEYRWFKYGVLDYSLPYLWSVGVAQEPSDRLVEMWDPGSATAVATWAGVEDTLDPVMDDWPLDVALTPPEWRRYFAYLWEMPEASPWSKVRMAANPEGIEIVATSRDGQAEPARLLVPPTVLRHHRLTVADILAGLAGGGLAADIRLLDVEGFDLRTGDQFIMTPGRYSTLGAEIPIPEPGWDDVEDTPRTGISLEKLRALVEEGPARPNRPGPRVREVRPMQPGLTIPQVLDLVAELLRGEPAIEVLTKMGATAGEHYGRPALIGEGWYAEEHLGTWTVNVLPYPPRGVTHETREVLGLGWWLAQALEGRYGRPFGQELSTWGHLMRLFRVGRTGVEVSVGSEVEVNIGEFEGLTRYAG
ncbi:hypothetical protein [Actinomyces procaprae]|uniref:hypothetical protein n=1 Tax=Actinomyces procaprae TaxID=2560010 RepID=UPI0010A23BB0|nr:hypothetical protein [Actinomyces procaprae]